MLATYVTADTGTGAVHTAPAHGADDFYTGVRYNIDPICRVDGSGRVDVYKRQVLNSPRPSSTPAVRRTVLLTAIGCAMLSIPPALGNRAYSRCRFIFSIRAVQRNNICSERSLTLGLRQPSQKNARGCL